ncbi:hypothetical protein NC652_005855 [Populus alba x Populus x berolinensis]|nr:hypothetical protein NC652_005855 [Populus alba x Populus x berolinensis]
MPLLRCPSSTISLSPALAPSRPTSTVPTLAMPSGRGIGAVSSSTKLVSALPPSKAPLIPTLFSTNRLTRSTALPLSADLTFLLDEDLISTQASQSLSTYSPPSKSFKNLL